MKQKILIMIMLIAFSALIAEKMMIRFDKPSNDLVKYFYENNYDVAAHRPGDYLDVVVTAAQKRDLENQNYNFKIQLTEEQIKANLNSRELEEYTNYQELETLLNEYETNHPEICKVYDIGDSWGKIYAEDQDYYQPYNHEILALKLSDNPTEYEDEPSIYYLGAHHAREPISVEVVLNILDYLVSNYGLNDTITDDIDNKQIWFVPMVNPNGNKIVLDEDDIWWRKNIRDNNENGVFDTENYYGYGDDGVDPNRNYGFMWGATGTASDPSYTTYNGPNAFSEPEILAVRDLVQNNKFVAGISYHSHSELVIYPFGFANDTYAPDNTAIADLAVSMAETIPQVNQNGYYIPGNSWELYPAMGGTDDWAYGVESVFSYTIELADQFIPPAEEIPEISDDNLESAMILLRRIDKSSLIGHVIDADNSQAIQAEIYVDGIDNFGYPKMPYLCDETYGSYYRMLPVGNYDVTFSASGYYPQTYNVEINSTTVTNLEVELLPITQSFETEIQLLDNNNQPISGAYLEIDQTECAGTYTNAEGLAWAELYEGDFTAQISVENSGVYSASFTVDVENPDVTLILQDALFYDSFENGLSNWNNNGFILEDGDSYSGDFSLADSEGYYGSDQNKSITLNQWLSTENESVPVLSFMTKYSIEAGYDYCALQIKEQFGDWIALETFDGESDWDRKTYRLDYYRDKSFQLRFIFYSDGGVEEDGIYIDDFFIGGQAEITDATTNVVDSPIISLSNYPNPFNPKTTIQFSIFNDSKVELAIYNLRGQLVKNIVDDHLKSGKHSFVWSGKDNSDNSVSSGIYFYKLKTETFEKINKAILIK